MANMAVAIVNAGNVEVTTNANYHPLDMNKY